MLSDTKLVENWEKLKEIINTTFTGEKRDLLNKMYEHFEERAVMAPASSIEHYHNAFPGGYIDHVLRVIDLSLQLFDVWERNGAVFNFTKETLIFCAMHHDLGKLGSVDEEFYIPNDSQWHREHQGKMYSYNPKIINMSTADRTFFILQYFGIKYTETEFIGIKCTDGMYDEENGKYLKTSYPEQIVKTNIVHILHHADMTATRLEYERWATSKSLIGMVQKGKDEPVVMHKKQNLEKISQIVNKTGTTNGQQIFEDLFRK